MNRQKGVDKYKQINKGLKALPKFKLNKDQYIRTLPDGRRIKSLKPGQPTII